MIGSIITWLVDLVGQTLAIIILAGILTFASVSGIIVASLCVASGRLSEYERRRDRLAELDEDRP